MSIFQICEFLSTIYMTFFEDCTISDKSDEEDHEVSMKYHMQMHVQ